LVIGNNDLLKQRSLLECPNIGFWSVPERTLEPGSRFNNAWYLVRKTGGGNVGIQQCRKRGIFRVHRQDPNFATLRRRRSQCPSHAGNPPPAGKSDSGEVQPFACPLNQFNPIIGGCVGLVSQYIPQLGGTGVERGKLLSNGTSRLPCSFRTLSILSS